MLLPYFVCHFQINDTLYINLHCSSFKRKMFLNSKSASSFWPKRNTFFVCDSSKRCFGNNVWDMTRKRNAYVREKTKIPAVVTLSRRSDSQQSNHSLHRKEIVSLLKFHWIFYFRLIEPCILISFGSSFVAFPILSLSFYSKEIAGIYFN